MAYVNPIIAAKQTELDQSPFASQTKPVELGELKTDEDNADEEEKKQDGAEEGKSNGVGASKKGKKKKKKKAANQDAEETKTETPSTLQ